MSEGEITLADLREDSRKALAALPDTVSDKELETVISIGSMEAVQRFLDYIRKEQRFSKPFARHLFPDLSETVAHSMQTEFNAQSWALKPQTTYLKHYLDTYGLSKIKDLSETTIEGLRQSLETNIIQGIDPRAASRMIRPQIGLTARQSAAVNRRYFKMLEDGIRPDIARSRSLRYHDHLLKYRADTIARTELISAQNHGKLEAWNQASDKGLFDRVTSVKEWTAAADACDECLDLDGERQRLDAPFSAGVMSPPLHPRCRCSMNLIQNAEPTVTEPLPSAEALPAGPSVSFIPRVKPGVPEAPPPTNISEPIAHKPPLTPAGESKTVAEAEKWVVKNGFAKEASYKGLDVEAANEINRALVKQSKLTKFPKFDYIGTATKSYGGAVIGEGGALAATDGYSFVVVSPDLMKNKKVLAARLRMRDAECTKAIADKKASLAKLISHEPPKARDPEWHKLWEDTVAYKKREIAAMPTRNLAADSVYDVINHELGHVAHYHLGPTPGWDTGADVLATLKVEERAAASRISRYAAASPEEHFAEAWTAYFRGEKEVISKPVLDLVEKAVAKFRISK